VRVVAVVQARMGSTRLPGKVMKPIAGVPLIELLMTRLSRATEIDAIALATGDTPDNAPLIAHMKSLGLPCIIGSERDVLGRYVKAGREMKADAVVRLTGDCPLVDPVLVDRIVRTFREGDFDYVSNLTPPTFPHGLDIEVVAFSALERADATTSKAYDREHVTPFVRESGLFSSESVSIDPDHSAIRITVDEPEDLDVVKDIFAYFAPDIHFGWEKIVALNVAQPELFNANDKFDRVSGGKQTTDQKLQQRAAKVIAPDIDEAAQNAWLRAPTGWSAYFSRAAGCTLWDLDGRAFVDMGGAGADTGVLGHSHPEVEAAVIETLSKGELSAFKCPEGVVLAERLLDVHPWADLVRFARSSTEANAMAQRIARAATGRPHVARCWEYPAARMPSNIQGTFDPRVFDFDGIAQLEALVRHHQIGAIQIDMALVHPLETAFLQHLRKIATTNACVLIFDETRSGFRDAFGGRHMSLGVEADMTTFGRTLGNGYAISAVIGRREIMQTPTEAALQPDRIGFSAALKTLDVIEQQCTWQSANATGQRIHSEWRRLADQHRLGVDIVGLPSLASLAFKSNNARLYSSILSQEMLKASHLARETVALTTAHSPEIVAAYLEHLDPVFGLLRECEEGRDPLALLDDEADKNRFLGAI